MAKRVVKYMKPAEKVVTERKLLEKFVDIGNRFRSTPIVDDDFCGLRNEFDALLKEATNYIKDNTPVLINKQRVSVDECMGLQETMVTIIYD